VSLWTWSTSASPDVAAYILAAALRWIDLEAPADSYGGHPTATGAWTDVVQVSSLSADDGLPDPPVGMVWMVSVDAVDGAGNRSSGE